MSDTRFKLMDYHLHTSRCLHASGSMQAYVQSAADAGIVSAGFADHAPNTGGFDPAHRMNWHAFEAYTAEIDGLRRQFPEVEILTGIEADIYPGFETDLAALKDRFPIDYVIGSVHYINERLIFKFDQEGMPDGPMHVFLADYFHTLKTGITSGLIDIIGHLDVVKYIYKGVVTDELRTALGSLFPLLAQQRMIVELNTSGYRKLPGQPFPDMEFWPVMAGFGIRVCLGSDAHAPEQVGYRFDSACRHLHHAGFQNQIRSENGCLVFTAA